MSGFHGAFATGVASQQGTLTLPDTWFRPKFWDLLVLQLLRPNSSNLPCLYSTFHLEYPLVLSRFCFHDIYEIKIPYSDFKPRISHYANSLFQAKWDICVRNKLHEINDTFLPSLKIYSDNRKEDIILTRLRIGHSRLTHKHYLANEDPLNVSLVTLH